MRKNHTVAPAKLPSVTPNIAFNSHDKRIFYKILALSIILFSFALIDIFNINYAYVSNLIHNFIIG
jgi:hypothetical protein